ncbi:hypothetical protein XENTR_v10008200 [Xenopus tropicalis]|nr:hypothetical protein XENTR_v10008200 [Xenopus tropicalis]
MGCGKKHSSLYGSSDRSSFALPSKLGIHNVEGLLRKQHGGVVGWPYPQSCGSVYRNSECTGAATGAV